MVRSSSRLHRHILGINYSANNRQCQLLRVPVPYTLTTCNIEKLGPSPFGHWRMFVGRGFRGFFIPVYIGGSPRIGVTQVQYERGQTLRGLVWTPEFLSSSSILQVQNTGIQLTSFGSLLIETMPFCLLCLRRLVFCIWRHATLRSLPRV